MQNGEAELHEKRHTFSVLVLTLLWRVSREYLPQVLSFYKIIFNIQSKILTIFD